jgi:hypothetical protein
MGQYSNALKFTNGTLDLTSTAAQEAYKLLSDLGRATSESTAKAIEANAPWEQVRGNWQKSYNDLVTLADGMGLSKTKAQELATQILVMPPSREIYIEARIKQAKSDIEGLIAAFEATPDAQTVTVEALTSDAIDDLEALGFKITRLPDGKTQVTTTTGSATSAITALRSLLQSIDGMTADTYTTHHISTIQTIVNQSIPGPHASGYNFGKSGGLASS